MGDEAAGVVAVILDVVIHMDAVSRQAWSGPPDARPLTELGRRQAEHIAGVLAADGVDGLFSSVANRCRQSLEPLSALTSLPIVAAPDFRDTAGYRAPAGWEAPEGAAAHPLGGALAAGSASRGLKRIEAAVGDGRGVLCSYGDIVPALLAFLAGAHDLTVPGRSAFNEKGVVFRITVERDVVAVTSAAPPPGFPT
jgi:broad specificity phosphatase PhoE